MKDKNALNHFLGFHAPDTREKADPEIAMKNIVRKAKADYRTSKADLRAFVKLEAERARERLRQDDL